MKNASDHKPLSRDLPTLTKTEINSLFLNSLSDVYNMQVHFLSYLPLMAGKASFPRLKMAIMDAALEIEAQKFRINLIFKVLKYEQGIRPEPLKGNLDVESYISRNLSSLSSYKTDFILFTHLLMLENMEITYFRTLKLLARNIQHREIYSLVRQCLREAIRKRRVYELIGKMYMMEPEPVGEGY